MTTVFNLGSIIIGLTAWCIPVVALVSQKKRNCCILSFTCCCIALMLQLCEIKHRCDIGDTSAVMDTIQAILLASIVLVTGTVVLNLIVRQKHKGS